MVVSSAVTMTNNIFINGKKIECGTTISNVASYSIYFILLLGFCHGLHILLKPLSQPRIITETLVGLFLGNLPPVRELLKIDKPGNTGLQNLKFLIDFGMTIYMFALGLEMDPSVLFRVPKREAIVAYTGMFFTFILTCITTPYLHYARHSNIPFNLAFSIILSSTGSPLLTRLLTDLKIGKSDIGKFSIFAAVYSELVTILIICIGYVIFQPEHNFQIRKKDPRQHANFKGHGAIPLGSALLAQIILTMTVGPIILGWVNGANPHGKTFKGLEAEFGKFEFQWLGSWARLFGFFGVGTIGKIIGAVITGLIFGFQWPESISLALLLNVKGHLHLYLTIVAMKNKIITDSTCIGMILAMLLKIVYIPMVAQYIIQRARRRLPNQPLALQWHDPTKELRILIGLHGPENVPCAINLMEISKGTCDPGIVVYATDMIELTDQIAATLVPGGVDDVTVTDKEVLQMRENITNSLQEYTKESEDCVTLCRAMALSTFNNMHQEICSLAEDSMISLLVLPFHNALQGGPKLVDSHTGFRYVNKKVFRNAPCTIAIMVDRGFGATGQLSKSSVGSFNVAVIFIGGKDDREALAYAGRVAYHRGVKLTIVRFLVEIQVENSTRKTSQQEEEMKLDDECFANFYERYVAGGKVSYLEKHLVNSVQAYSTLRSLEGHYGLFIIGRGGRVNSVLTMGMNDWEQCPELGPLGDILSGPNFSTTSSVLIIQQHNPKGEPGGSDNEFSIM